MYLDCSGKSLIHQEKSLLANRTIIRPTYNIHVSKRYTTVFTSTEFHILSDIEIKEKNLKPVPGS